MKSLYESILSTTNSGKDGYLKGLLMNRGTDIEELNRIWKKYGLQYTNEKGEEIGMWFHKGITGRSEFTVYSVPIVSKSGKFSTGWIASVGNDLASDIVVNKNILDMKITPIKKWAEKIQSVLNMEYHEEKNHIYLNFKQ